MKLSTIDKRGQVRAPHHEIISFSVSNTTDASRETPTTITAQIIDISATGMGIATDLMLSKNQTIEFKKNQPNWELPDAGVVVWSYKQNNGCRAGIEFIDSEGK